MSKLYRVTPKNNKWIIQKIDDRSTVSDKPFVKKTDAENAMYAMIASEGKQVTTTETLITFKQAFKKFADWKMSLYSPEGRVNETSLKRYDQEYRLRISKYMNDNVMLSKFNLLDMENYLDNLKAAGIWFKSINGYGYI